MSLDFDSARLPNPDLSPEHQAWREQLRRFFERELMPLAEHWDEAGKMPADLWPKAVAVGLVGLGYPEQYGGSSEGIDIWHKTMLNEELARFAVGGVSANLMVHNIGRPPVVNFASDAIKQQVVTAVLSGSKRISLCITEPGAGSDVAQLATTARLDGDHYVVNGSKTTITGGMNANGFTTREAMQILGGIGTMRGSRVERSYREVRVNAIGGGSEEIMRDLAARQYGL